ncbi:MAG: TIGR04076 family protein [Candidatus Bathyarchaeota archaeon]|nr:TIGR04076 family protein [Candidatus Bathyarchaeota archaeon]
MKRSKVKITVLKKIDPATIFNGNIPNIPGTDKKYQICQAFKEGQEYIVEMKGERPEGFCVWAWNDLFKDMSILHFGGNFPWAEEGTTITCCTDGIRPVSFKLERLDIT